MGPANPNPDLAIAQASNWSVSALLFTATGPLGTHIFAPSAGVVTRWRFYTDVLGAGVTFRLRTLKPLGLNSYRAVAAGPAEAVAAVDPQGPQDKNLLHTFAANVPIDAGEIPGVELAAPVGVTMTPIRPNTSGWSVECFHSGCASPVPAVGATATSTSLPGQFLALNAEVEPDLDGDRFGDESQDRCLGKAGADRGCAPGELDVKTPDPVIVVNTVQPGSALALLDASLVKLSADRKTVSVSVACPAQKSTRCKGAVAISAKPKKSTFSLGRKSFSTAAGKSQKLAIRVPAKARTAIVKIKKLKITVTLTSTSKVSKTS